ncbi:MULTISPECIES: DUF4940 domain-containing protein [unclassified Thermotoga]|uniref:DUF4940 domain-containing protein n=1 Tax=unclassified Thermotoga TaxID=2631113 RepID=UPI000318B2BC|nr:MULTISPECIES: DUF4940 domain-containing protein [unclassified Thermotoga]AIY85750.1 hypothetical protein T2812B_00995 [Thermotoga sp. 2812B]
MLRFPENVVICDGKRILWNGLGLPENLVFEMARTVLESNVPLKGKIFCFPAQTVLGKMAIFTDEKTQGRDVLVELLNHELLRMRLYSEEVENLVEVLFNDWRPGKRVFIVRSKNFETRLSLREKLSSFADVIYNAGEIDVGIAPAGTLLQINEEKVSFSDPERDIKEAVRKALLMDRYVNEPFSFYEKLPSYNFSLNIQIPELVKIFLRTGDIQKTSELTEKSVEVVFREILEFEKKTLLSPRIPVEAFLILKGGLD